MTLSVAAAQELAGAIGPDINAAGSSFYFHPATLARGKELGLDGMRFYILGRGGVLGDVEPDVVASAFGYFNRELIAKLWGSAKTTLAPREAGAAYHACSAALGRVVLADVEGLETYCDAAEAVIGATNRAGLALFAGIAAEPLVDDLPGRAMQLTAVLRELRGSTHLNALLATGVVPEVAHANKRPEMVGAFGWDPAPSTEGLSQEQVDQAEALTDVMMARSLQGLSDDQAAALEAGAAAIAAACATD